ncbi:thioester reductase domain-containing protein [Trichocoleus sp. FACHB-90]|uniref:type I polyketide synthase n=1 Tax=Trichocoleus sp. FACHB-90 TaxID=2692876 RepID=UPI001683D304|nr:type I polyketide synthase [Trichocoleus sp. FACHB-90]MBD1926369.1 thioester reductase domain-containing protein [Trichocoleus sp. FACHB-90]
MRGFAVEPIAIIGLGCRFPGANDPEAFWQLLSNGVDAIAQVPKERWDIDAFYDPEPGKPGKMSTRWGGFLEQVDQFEPSFFGIAPREVERMDPQQRLALEVAWEALENAAIVPSKLSGTQTGVFMAIGNYDYCRLLTKDLNLVNAYDGTGNTLSITANRLSYILNLRGPSVVIETACSSSLVALHYACRSLESGESNLCLVGGVSLMLSPEPFITYSHARMMAADGRCKTFDASADGYVRGEGCGVVVLKRLSDALRDGDNIKAVIKGSAVNQDGLSNGLTAPNGPSQQAVIRQALENADVQATQISYVEAHGTGTSLGDPIEVKSLKAVLMQNREPDQPCWIGSVKTNIGHLEAASGMASVIKVVLSLQHKEIPPHLHLKQLNPYISLEGTTFAIPAESQAWDVGTQRRLAGISAFGFGGTNCHAILEEAPQNLTPPPATAPIWVSLEGLGVTCDQPTDDITTLERPLHLLTLSAKTENALRELAQRYANFFATHPEASLEDVCFTANTARSHFDHRFAVTAESTVQLQEQLTAFAAGKETVGLVSNPGKSNKRPKIAFLFTGQGSQYVGMGRELYATQPIFRQALDCCDRILRPYLEQPLLSVLYPESGINSPLNETAYTQPALFALEYALFQLWKSWGLTPDVVMGHSVGEYVAACVAGVFSLEDGLKLIAERARLMQALPAGGEMVAVFASESKVQAVIQPYIQEVAIAAINGPKSIVISGQAEAVGQAIASLQAEGIKTKKLTVSHAFHSPLMSPMLADFERVAAEIAYSSPKVKLVSNVTGELATDAIATPEYWCRHVLEPVRFAKSMETLYQKGYKVFVEIGPKPILLGMGRYCLPDAETFASLPSLRPERSDWQQILQSLAELYVRGVAVDWSGFDQDYPRRRLQLPTYPFQRQRYWVEFSENGHSNEKPLTPMVKLLNQGDTQQLIQQLETIGKLSEDELKLLPKLLELLVKQNKQPLTAASIKDWLYEIEWQLKPRQLTENQTIQPAEFSSPPLAGERSGRWLIFADLEGVGENLAILRDRCNCILVYPGDTYQTTEPGTYTINPSNPADFERLFQEIGNLPLQGILHLWSLEAGLADKLTIPSLENAQTLGVASVLNLVQTLTGKENQFSISNSQPKLWLVTRGAVPVGGSLPGVAQAPLWGLGKVVALEHRELWGGMLDLAPEATEDEAAKLLAEIENAQGEDHLAFRDGQRYVARLVQKELPESQGVALNADSTYLITGGLGALGLKVAQWMLEQGAKHLVLTGRSAVSSQAREVITQMEEAGAEILVAQADVCNGGDMLRVLEEVEASMPPLRGVIHAAGVSRYEAIADMDLNALNSVLRPKLVGTWILHQLTQKIKLDFFVSFSSISAVWGSKGQAHYAAANHFLDMLAHYRLGLGLPALSVNWGPWAGGGMALEEFQTFLTRMGVEALQPQQALSALGYLLGAGCVQTTVANVDWTLFKDLYEARGKRSLLELLEVRSPETPQQSVQRSEILQRLETTPVSDRHSLLITHLQSEVAKVLRLPQLPDPQQGLFDLGMDSLMAVEVVSLIRSQLQIELPVREFLEASNITLLAALLLKQLTPDISTVDVTVNVLNLYDEAVLDEAINPNTANAQQTEAASILLTGASGFLGAFLLKELLEQTNANIYCLVRAADAEVGKLKIRNNLKSYDLWKEKYNSRIISIAGNLSQPRLGLSTEQFENLARTIDIIYHNAATLNFVYPYSALKPTNVLGTQEILRLACQFKVKPLHYVSTDAVFDSSGYYGKEVKESEPTIHIDGIDLGYTQTKWVAEKLVTIARDRGLPVSIYRPPLIAGDSKTGIWNTDDFTCRFLKGCIQMGSMPNMNCGITIVPVDYVSQAVVYLSRQKESLGKAFHLNNPNFSSWDEVANWIDDLGYPVRQISYEEWEAELIETVGSKDNALSGLLPFFLRRWSDEQLTFAGLGQRRVKLNCQDTVNKLADSAIACPRVDSKLLKTYFSYFSRSGFLNAPKVRA